MVSKIEKNRTILDEIQLDYILQRLSHQLIETHGDFTNTILIGVQPRGTELCDRIHKIISTKLKKTILKGYVDISMHRDDIHIHGTSLQMGVTEIPCSLDEINIILIDDVLYTGRTIRAALDTLMDYGRPKDIELLVLIDRRLHRHVPIQAKYVGKTIDSIQREKVKVILGNEKEKDKVVLITSD